MAEKYSDYYIDKSKILTMVEYGNPIQRRIALTSLIIHFGKEDHYDLAWRIFLSDEHFDVKETALQTACYFDNEKQLWKIGEYLYDNKELNKYSRILFSKLLEIHKKRKV